MNPLHLQPAWSSYGLKQEHVKAEQESWNRCDYSGLHWKHVDKYVHADKWHKVGFVVLENEVLCVTDLLT